MKIFKALVQRDGQFAKTPVGCSTELETLEYYYAARTIEDVWAYTEFMRLDPDLSFIGIFESAPAIHVIEGEPY